MKDSTCDRTSKKFKKSLELQKKTDKTTLSNAMYLLHLFEKYGFIGEELVGRKKSRSTAVIVMLLHFDADTNNKILKPILLNALYKGKLLPYNLRL